MPTIIFDPLAGHPDLRSHQTDRLPDTAISPPEQSGAANHASSR